MARDENDAILGDDIRAVFTVIYKRGISFGMQTCPLMEQLRRERVFLIYVGDQFFFSLHRTGPSDVMKRESIPSARARTALILLPLKERRSQPDSATLRRGSGRDKKYYENVRGGQEHLAGSLYSRTNIGTEL